MSQLAFHQLIAKAIERSFLISPQVEEDFLHFKISESGLATYIFMQAFEPEPEFKAVKISMWFCHQDGSRMNFCNIDFSDALVLSNLLTFEIEWGTIVPFKYDEDNIGICLTSTIETEEDDLIIMRNLDQRSNLLRNMLRLCQSAEHIYPALYGVSSGQISDFKLIEMFLSEDEETAQ